jgi:hypothetical protein
MAAVVFAGLIILTTACGSPATQPTLAAAAPALDSPTATPSAPTPEPTITPEATATPVPVLPVEPYPASALDLLPAQDSAEAEAIVRSYPDADSGITAMQKMFAEWVAGQEGVSLSDYVYEYQVIEGKSWVMVIRNAKTGNILVPQIDGLNEVSLMTWGHISEYDTDIAFVDDHLNFVEAKNPEGHPDAKQTVRRHRSGHFLVVYEEGDKSLGYLDVARDAVHNMNGGEYVNVQHIEDFFGTGPADVKLIEDHMDQREALLLQAATLPDSKIWAEPDSVAYAPDGTITTGSSHWLSNVMVLGYRVYEVKITDSGVETTMAVLSLAHKHDGKVVEIQAPIVWFLPLESVVADLADKKSRDDLFKPGTVYRDILIGWYNKSDKKNPNFWESMRARVAQVAGNDYIYSGGDDLPSATKLEKGLKEDGVAFPQAEWEEQRADLFLARMISDPTDPDTVYHLLTQDGDSAGLGQRVFRVASITK